MEKHPNESLNFHNARKKVFLPRKTFTSNDYGMNKNVPVPYQNQRNEKQLDTCYPSGSKQVFGPLHKNGLQANEVYGVFGETYLPVDHLDKPFHLASNSRSDERHQRSVLNKPLIPSVEKHSQQEPTKQSRMLPSEESNEGDGLVNHKSSVDKEKAAHIECSSRGIFTKVPLEPTEFKLKNKRNRHVYHTITLPLAASSKSISNEPLKISSCSEQHESCLVPEIPCKPHFLRSEYNTVTPPPVPPRIINKDAVMRRRQLNEEYFENIVRNVDVDFFLNDSVNVVANPASTSNVSGSSHMNHSNFSLPFSVPIPGTETHPYWTITDNLDSVSQRRSAPLLDIDVLVQSATSRVRAQSSGTIDLSKNVSHVSNNSQHHMIQSLRSLKHCGWYWGDMTWEEAEAMLDQRSNEIGLFLVRDSHDPLHILTVTVRTEEYSIRHVRIEHTDGKFQLYDPGGSMNSEAAGYVRHPNVITFIERAIKHSRSGNFLYFVRPRSMGEAPVQIQLLNSISRFACVKSLKYYARFAIRERVPLESVNELPVPVALKKYLSKSHYFDPLEDYCCATIS